MLPHSILKIVALLSIIQAAMCTTNSDVSPDPKDFFSQRVNGNLTKVTWAHAVNNVEYLQKVLGNEEHMMIEADVVMGSLTNTSGNETEEIPIMAHPPSVESDLSLEQFLENVLADGKHGIKLDFKSIEAFNASRPILEAFRAKLKFPVWLNADIISGPVDATPADQTPVNPSAFLAGAAASFPESTLSIGWTTRYGQKVNITKGAYTQEQMRSMVEALGHSEMKQSVTYPVRAGIAASDMEVFKNLIKDTSVHKPTLTIWSSENDTVDCDALSKLILGIGVDMVYLDVPADVRSKLRISGAPSLAASSIMLFGALVASFAIAKMI